MHWVIQENLHGERGFQTLIDTLEKFEIPHDLVKVIPFVGETIPDVNPEGKIFVIGSMSMHRVAKRKGWDPGVIMIPDMLEVATHWKHYLLNSEYTVGAIGTLNAEVEFPEPMFIRPYDDSKAFNGTIMDAEDFADMQRNLTRVASDKPTCSLDTQVIISPLKEILREYRFFIVDGEVATGSMYKRGGKVLYSDELDGALDFVKEFLKVETWRPAKAFVLDVAMVPSGYDIIEINNLNSAGFYASDIQKLVMAIEDKLGR